MPVLTTSALMIEADKKANSKATERSKLQQIPCIYYSALFGKFFIKALINSGSKVNSIQLRFVRKLNLRICKTDVGIHKIDGNKLETFKLVIALL